MGILKGLGKVVGTTALGATGIASTVIKGVFDAAGVTLGSEVFGAIKDGSFDCIRSMWDDESASQAINRLQNSDDAVADVTRRKMAETAYKMAQAAKENGDMDKYETYMAKYEQYK